MRDVRDVRDMCIANRLSFHCVFSVQSNYFSTSAVLVVYLLANNCLFGGRIVVKIDPKS